METTKNVIYIMMLRALLSLIILEMVTRNVDLKQDKFVLISTFIITVYLLDIADCAMITKNRECRSIAYQIADKIVDQLVLGYWTFIIIPIIDPENYETIKILWYYRLIGIILLAITQNPKTCFLFGNYVEMGILLSVVGWWKYPIVVFLLFLIKVIEEIILHSGLIDYFKFRNKITQIFTGI